MEEQIKARESKIMNYDKWEYLAQHVILSMTLTCLSLKIKNLRTAKEMWDMVKANATTKSTLFLLDAKDQLTSMKLTDNADLKAHLSELKEHFQPMMHQHNNLLKMGSTLSDSRFNTIIMLSLPESYCWVGVIKKEWSVGMAKSVVQGWPPLLSPPLLYVHWCLSTV